MKIKYYGHACFTVESEGYVVGFDPYDPSVPGYGPLHINVDGLYCSHDHDDHHYLPAVSFNEGCREKTNPFNISEFEIPHDDADGSKRGMNMVRILEAEGKKIAHMGDIGCMPGDEQYEMLKGCDLIMIPVGGFFTIDWKQAAEIAEKLSPECVIPMHFRADGCGYDVIGDIKDMDLGEIFRIMKPGEEMEI